KVALDHLHRPVRIEIAGDGQDRVVWTVEGLKELADVVQGGSPQVLHRSDHRVVIGVGLGVDQALQLLLPGPVRLVVDRPATLVLHYVSLVVELLVGHGGNQTGHAVGLEPKRALELMAREGLEVVGAIEPRRRVERAARGLYQAEMHSLFHVLRSLEHHVFEEVRETGLPRLLVLAADVVPEVDGYNGRAVVSGEDYPQAVRQAAAINRYRRQGVPRKDDQGWLAGAGEAGQLRVAARVARRRGSAVGAPALHLVRDL